jgi:hypothetical protein
MAKAKKAAEQVYLKARLPRELVQRAKSAAAERGSSGAAVVRDALEKFLSRAV